MKITTQMQGGLGNQLFQYATGKALSERLGGQLLVDIDWFNHEWTDVTPREFLLPFLKVQLETTQVSPPIQSPRRWRRITQQILPLNPYVLKDRPYRFNPALTQFKPFANQDIYLMGYWQSFRYFDSIRQQLIHEIRPINQLSPQYQIYLEKIKGCLSAMIHIRRGDYVNLPVAAKAHGFLGLDYYQNGMRLLLENDIHTHFFVFSDDLGWAKANLPHQEKITYIETANEKTAPIQELFLMTQCQRHLIANSSLSWWSAWLSVDQNPLVIAPKRWTNDLDKEWDDLLPSHWQRI